MNMSILSEANKGNDEIPLFTLTFYHRIFIYHFSQQQMIGENRYGNETWQKTNADKRQ
jgi:hypothetical protein